MFFPRSLSSLDNSNIIRTISNKKKLINGMKALTVI